MEVLREVDHVLGVSNRNGRVQMFVEGLFARYSAGRWNYAQQQRAFKCRLGGVPHSTMAIFEGNSMAMTVGSVNRLIKLVKKRAQQASVSNSDHLHHHQQ